MTTRRQATVMLDPWAIGLRIMALSYFSQRI